MARSQVTFDRFDAQTRDEAIDLLKTLDEGRGHEVGLAVGGELAGILRRFVAVGLEAGGVAYGPLDAELTPEQAGSILGISRPLVVQRMDDGRLPFRYVGSHRRCTLNDVLSLKAAEDSHDRLMRQMYGELEDLAAEPGL